MININVVYAQVCADTENHNAVQISGEVSGSHQYSSQVRSDWTFMLQPSLYGWDIRLYDKDGLDLTQITAPFRFAPNPREIYGWHFRNLDNTGPNEGDVNAQQHERRFIFSESLSGTGGFKPSTDGQESEMTLDENQGIGWLKINDFGLADLEKGQKARMVYLDFTTCLYMPKSEADKRKDEFNNSVFLSEETEYMKSCGLSDDFELSAWVLPRWLEGDLDGDDSNDVVAPVMRKSDGMKAVAICRAGTWITMLGSSHDQLAGNMDRRYIQQVEAWQITKTDDVPVYDSESSRPKTNRDILLLERIEKSAYSVYWDGAKFISHEHYVFVEP